MVICNMKLLNKHIQRRFLNRIENTTIDDLNPTGFDVYEGQKIKNKELKEGSKVMLEMTEGYVLQGVIIKQNGDAFGVPIPDPSLMYFAQAQAIVEKLKELEKATRSMTNIRGQLSELNGHKVFDYYSLTSVFCLTLVASIEAFVNHQLPRNYRCKNGKNYYHVITNKKLNQKLNDELPRALEIERFSKNNRHEWQNITDLLELRNDITHPKPQKPDALEYSNIMTQIVKLNPEKTISSVMSLLNYFKKDYIIECPCSGKH